MPRRPFFYGNIIVAICFLNLMLVGGLMASFSVFNVALLDAFRWSRATTAAIASVNGIAYTALSPLAGWAYDRLGPRVIMPLGGFFIGVALVLSGRSTSLWQFYLWYGLLAGLGIVCLDFVGTIALLSHWFRQRRATAIGFAAMGLGVGILLVPGVQLLITHHGWRAAMVLLGTAVLVSLAPLNALLQRRRPEDIGQLPDGASFDAMAPDTATATTPCDFQAPCRNGGRPPRLDAGEGAVLVPFLVHGHGPSGGRHRRVAHAYACGRPPGPHRPGQARRGRGFRPGGGWRGFPEQPSGVSPRTAWGATGPTASAPS